MAKKHVLSLLAALVLTCAAPLAHALIPYQSTTGTPVTVSANNYQVFSFTDPTNQLLSATLWLNIGQTTDSVRIIGGRTFTSPPSAEFYLDPTATYLFTADLKTGLNQLDLNNYLTQLNAGSGPIFLGMYMDRGGITLNNATLTGTMAPEPVSMALVGVGLVRLPFARRFRKTLAP